MRYAARELLRRIMVACAFRTLARALACHLPVVCSASSARAARPLAADGFDLVGLRLLGHSAAGAVAQLPGALKPAVDKANRKMVRW